MVAHDDILEMEREFWEADPAFHDAHYADDIVTIVGGQSSERGEVLEEISAVPTLTSLEMQDVQIREFTDEVVGLAHRARATREEQAEPYETMVGSVYVRRDGRWWLAFHQHSPREPEPDLDPDA